MCFQRISLPEFWKKKMAVVAGESSDYVRKYFDAKKHAFLRNHMRDFGRFDAKFLLVNYPRNKRCKIRTFVLKIMRVFPFLCVKTHIARP